MADAGQSERIFGHMPSVVEANDWIVLDARGFGTLTVVAGSGCTVTVTRVDNEEGLNLSDESGVLDEIGPDEAFPFPVDWPFYHVAPVGGSCRVALA